MSDDLSTDLEARVAALESRLAPAPLAANPPIIIGSLTDVPAPGSAIASQWAQEVTRQIVHKFPTKAAMSAWMAPFGSYATNSEDYRLYVRTAAVWTTTVVMQMTKNTDAGGYVAFTAAEFGMFKILGMVVVPMKAAGEIVPLTAVALAGDGSGGSIRTYYISGGMTIALPGAGTAWTFQIVLYGQP